MPRARPGRTSPVHERAHERPLYWRETQREIQAEIGQFRAADRLGRDEVHDRAVR